jgi:hypothetical protein
MTREELLEIVKDVIFNSKGNNAPNEYVLNEETVAKDIIAKLEDLNLINKELK